MPVDRDRAQITVYLPPDLHVSLKELAKARNKKLSHLAVDLLWDAVRRETALAGTTYLMPEISSMLEKKLSDMEIQFVRLMTRTAIESGATKRLVIDVLLALRIASPAEVDEMEKMAWHRAQESIRGPLEGLERLLLSVRSTEKKGD